MNSLRLDEALMILAEAHSKTDDIPEIGCTVQSMASLLPAGFAQDRYVQAWKTVHDHLRKEYPGWESRR